MQLTDREIRKLCTPGYVYKVPRLVDGTLTFEDYVVETPLVNPFVEPFDGVDVVSYGLTSAGFDLRLDDEELLVFKNTHGHRIDPKRFKDENYKNEVFDRRSFSPHDQVVVPAGGYVLARSFEYLYVPHFLKATCLGKSTFARCGVLVNTTPAEPEWRGHLTIEISNPTSCDLVLYALEGIAQIGYELLVDRPERTYEDKKGKYQDQRGVTPSIVR